MPNENKVLIINYLKEIKEIYRVIPLMTNEIREYFVLDGLIICAKINKTNDNLINYIQELKLQYPNGTIPFSGDGLVSLIRKKFPNYDDIPCSSFEKIMFCYKLANLTADVIFQKIGALFINKKDIFFINQLRNILYNSFVNNPCFAKIHDVFYYESNYQLTIEIFNSYGKMVNQTIEDYILFFEENL